jgi:hypothetical protein
MNVTKDLNHMFGVLRNLCLALKVTRGSVLVYLIVLILIFGILGVTMVSLFTTATTSSATPNCARRAFHMYESGTRYAFSELRNNDFDEDTINDLNSTTYNVTDAGSFTINVFSPWFESPLMQEGSNYTLTLNVPAGKLPLDSFVPVNSNVWIINFKYLETTDVTSTRSPISAYTRVDDTTLTIGVSGDFNVSTGDWVAMGVMPTVTQGPLAAGADLYVERVAKDFFPRFNGAININRVTYSYDRLVDEPGNNRVILQNLTASRFPNIKTDFPLTVTKTTSGTYTGDFIVLSPRNLIAIPTGTSSLCSPPVPYGGDYDDGMNIFGRLFPIPPKWDIDADEFTSNLTENQTSSSFINVDTDADTLNIGGGVASEFGAGWYDADKTIGSDNEACQAGACKFLRGIRVFFVLKFIEGRQGDGFTFTLMNAEGREPPPSNILLNTINSVGGDSERSELMGYAGDSRKDDGGFLDTTPPPGIQPPKLAIEFDTRTNFDAAFEDDEIEPEPKDFCIDSLSLKPNTRNDPSPGNSDAVQYVFWGDSSLNVPCRSANPDASVDTYDDNRHGTIEVPINDRTIAITSKDDLDPSVEVDDDDDWLNGSTFRGPWAIRIQIDREEFPNTGENPDYTIQTEIRQCATDVGSSNCTDASIIDSNNPFYNTALPYNFPPERLVQQVELTPDEHNAFRRFFFGFTGAAGSEELDVEISEFQLSFIR